MRIVYKSAISIILMRMDNVKPLIKEPMIHIYIKLYSTLKLYHQNYYAVGPRSKPTDTFIVSFYRPSLGSMYTGSTLQNIFTKVKKNRITLDPTNEAEFRKNLANVAFFMVKYSSSIVVKKGYSNSKINIFYASLSEILSEDYIKQAIYPPTRGRTSNQIGGTVSNPNNLDAWINSQDFADLSTD